mgnify:CR=1 FL=1
MDAEYFSGRVHSVVFENPDEGFYITRMMLDGQSVQTEPVSVRGNVQGLTIQTGSWFGFEARWEDHPKYGKQLAILRAPVLQGDWDADTAHKMLLSNGVSDSVLCSIRQHFPDEKDFLKALQDTEHLQEVSGISKFSALHVVQRWESVVIHFRTLAFLGTLGLTSGTIRSVWSLFKDKTEEVLSKNPWALARVPGINFMQADQVAARLGLSMDDPKRIEGAVLAASQNFRQMGHVFMTTGDLFEVTGQWVESLDQIALAKALVALHESGQLVIDKTTRRGTTAVYDPWFHMLETSASDLLLARVESAKPTREYIDGLAAVGPATEASVTAKARSRTVVATAVEEWEAQNQLFLSEDQKRGVLNALLEPVSILTGLPGSGKTTSLRAVIRILMESGIKILPVAPTGIAAKNIKARTGADASTIHRAFSATPGNTSSRKATYTGVVGDSGYKDVGTGQLSEWTYGPDHPHPAKCIIIDEASMLDLHLLYRVLSCTGPDCRVVFVGDHAQLPSVGPGNVLKDLIASELFPTVKLTQIFRQKDTSDIVYAAHAIHRGETPDTSPTSDYALLPVSDDERVLVTVLKIALKLYERKANFQVLSPRHAGTLGVTNLNSRLRELINPAAPGVTETRMGKETIREGDRIMVVKNDYLLGVYNGDVGKITRIDAKKKEVLIKVFGEPPLYVPVPFKTMGQLLRLAYATTVHKAQGLEYDHIVMPMVTGFRHQLQRNLLYTASTRARKRVMLVGSRHALALAVGNDREEQRQTLLIDRLAVGQSTKPEQE